MGRHVASQCVARRMPPDFRSSLLVNAALCLPYEKTLTMRYNFGTPGKKLQQGIGIRFMGADT
jgi:hypothetical protein